MTIYKDRLLNQYLNEYIKDYNLQNHFKINFNKVVESISQNNENLKYEIKSKLGKIMTLKNTSIEYEINLIKENYSQKLFENYLSKINLNQINFNCNMNNYKVISYESL
jgi:hypothetical protein